jgi:hypothetical protein
VTRAPRLYFAPQAKPLQRQQSRGLQQQTRAKRACLREPLEHAHVVTGTRKRNRRGLTRNARPDHPDAQLDQSPSAMPSRRGSAPPA